MELLHEAGNIEICHDTQTKILYCRWIGPQTREGIMSSGATILKLLKQNKITKVLNDNTEVNSPWTDAAEWTSCEWFPNMKKAGLQHFAWILSGNIFAELSAKKAMEGSEAVMIFYSFQEAQAWLRAQK